MTDARLVGDRIAYHRKRLGLSQIEFAGLVGPAGKLGIPGHAVSVAVDLGDAGHALDLARDVDYQELSPERRARHIIDLAAVHAMRRRIGEAIRDLQEAEDLTPELTRAHHGARLVSMALYRSLDFSKAL